MLINAPKGTRDILPAQIHRWRHIEKKFAETVSKYGYKEIRTPVFEHTELFQRGVGETTDIVQKEMYTFKDHGDRSITLKPEGTASCVRAFIEHKEYAEVQPTKYYYATACYRYEKPQAGRLREFHQFGVEVFGTDNMLADAEVIVLAKNFLNECGIKDIELRINSIGCPTCRAKYKEALIEYYKPHVADMCSDCRDRFERNPIRLIDCKVPQDHELALNAPMMIDYLCDDCRTAFDELKSNLDCAGVEYVVDPAIVRGLDYYTKTAFEFVTSQIGAQGTVCGGGRYDHLIEEIGGPPMPGVGFGLGMERLLLLMEQSGVDIPGSEGPDAMIAVMGDKAKEYGIRLAEKLRRDGLSVQMDLLARNIKGQLKYADRIGAKYAVVIGDNEIESGTCQLKELSKSEQREVSLDKLADLLKGSEV